MAPSPFFVDKLFKLTLSRNTLQINNLQRPNPHKPLIINNLCNVNAFFKKTFLSFFRVRQFLSYPLCYAKRMNNMKKYLVPFGFAEKWVNKQNPFFVQWREFPVSREENGLDRAIEFAAQNEGSVYVQDADSTVKLVWQNPIYG